eukprot:scaffold87672_cov72-Phaeocystis_antarctica.AAC.1
MSREEKLAYAARLKQERRQLCLELGVEEQPEQPQPKPPPLPSSPLPRLPQWESGGAASARAPKVLHAAVFNPNPNPNPNPKP